MQHNFFNLLILRTGMRDKIELPEIEKWIARLDAACLK